MSLSIPSFDGKILDFLPSEGKKEEKTLQFSKYGDIHITLRAKAETNITSKAPKNWCKIQVGDQPILVRLSDLASTLHISKKVLKQANDEGHLREAIDIALRMMVQPHEQKKISSLSELDRMVGKEVVTTQNERITLTQEVIDKIKSIVQTEYKGFLAGSAVGKTERIASVSKDLHIRIKSSKDTLKINALFGQFLAKGGGGKVAVASYHLVLGKPDSKPKRVIKTPLQQTEDAKREILQEVAISKKLNKNGPILGVQEPLSLRVITATNDQNVRQEAYMHAGRLYDGDLLNNLENLSDQDKLSIGYQMFNGVSKTHDLDITHGDIKLENYFFQKEDTRVFLADLAGAKDHSTPQTSPQDTFSYWRPVEDVKKGRSIMKELNAARKKDPASKETKALELKFKEIEKKADVFTLCAAFGILAVNNPEFSVDKLRMGTVEHLQSLKFGEKLRAKGWSPAFAKLIDKGLSANPDERPTAKELLKAYREHLKTTNPQILKTLAKK